MKKVKKKQNNPLVSISAYLIKKIWQGQVGTKLKKNGRIMCRFHPSCSNYAILALEKHGFVKGWRMSYERIKRCDVNNTESCIDFP